MKKLLLTGFEPFLDYPTNPTMKVVEVLDGKEIGEFEVIGKILSVDFKQSGSQLVEYFEEVKPDAVISLGLAAGRYKITPERIAINCSDGDRDNSGHRPLDERIVENGMDGMFSTLPIRNMVERLNGEGFPAEISNTAGTYLCNNVMYTMLHYLQQKGLTIPSGFIHIPASHELGLQYGKVPSWSQSDLTRAIELCVEELKIYA
ncbi:pyroglutamyl-peptidase [Bacillus pakistanensis]|uniref:Pyrrolidone-carboxylate peptidase n=1 Tax=Rossellomorea pakistanensis TaxID=992288 RepID=A0ABS2ND27_9BACI|nr:pyroglutamyl-peptidase I [Bacillus pakistanensis]MBM7585715.1 pyroglutamyl-peptidase [Bacillus pakistanensis]